MIDLTDVRDTVGQVVADSGLFPRRSWSNKDSTLEKPYLVLNLVSSQIADATLAQTSPVWTGMLMATVVTGLDEFDTVALGMVKDLAELFPSATRMTLAGGGKTIVSGHPQPQPGYRDNSYFRTPVSIPLRSE